MLIRSVFGTLYIPSEPILIGIPLSYGTSAQENFPIMPSTLQAMIKSVFFCFPMQLGISNITVAVDYKYLDGWAWMNSGS